MRGGVARWKRGVASQGVKQAIAYAFGGVCDATLTAQNADGVLAAADYADAVMTRYSVENGQVSTDQLDRNQLRSWVDGGDPVTGEHRGVELPSPNADLVLDATINAPKSFSVAAMLDTDLNDAYEGLQDRLRERIITMWQAEMNARRGHAGAVREGLDRIEVVELKHERSRSLDPHKHRHLWLNMKVRGRDGRWSNIDSRVVMKFQTVVNAEGDLAARTDPEWVAALAAKGYTLDGAGEIEQLAHLVRPLSRRSTQIEANRAVKLTEWYDRHPGQEPDRDVLAAIDRWAWAAGRPNKPGQLNEDDWAARVRDEVTALDPAAVRVMAGPATVAATAIADVDRDLLAARATVDADGRSTGTGGRFSVFDVRAGATRAVAASGVVADRAVLQELIDDVTERAIVTHTVTLVTDTMVPGHVKHMMATTTAATKAALAAALDELDGPGAIVPADAITELAASVLEDGRELDAGQTDAAAAIAGTDRLVTVTGPAGTGKTTMLKVARECLTRQGRHLIVVAPTKKAASVAGRETGATASSLHGLLRDHGWRWAQDPAGRTVWTRLQTGDVDQATGEVFEGPRKYPIGAGDRIVVDEAGMVDIETGLALAQLAKATGAGVAMVGDHLQALPVGHSGAMALAKRCSTAVVELTAVHRFKDPGWAELSLRLRDPGGDEDAARLAGELIQKGHVALVANDQEAREHMVEGWIAAHGRGETIALVTATHAEAQSIGEAIQARRLQVGNLAAGRTLSGQDSQTILEGDIVQTRRNNAELGVENRALWTVKTISRNGAVLVNVDDSADTRTITADYAADHLHLGYASTVHGIQGETTDRAIVGPGVDAAGLYVGMTRGRTHNQAVLTASTEDAAKAALVESMRRGSIEATIDDSRTVASAELARAARTPVPVEDAPAAPWHDRRQRPAGAVIDLDKYIADANQAKGTLHSALADVADRIARDQRTLEQVSARLARVEASNHQASIAGQPAQDAGKLELVAERLQERLDTDRHQRRELSQQYRSAAKRADKGDSEQSYRSRLSDSQRRQEEHERKAAAAARIAPHSTPTRNSQRDPNR